MEQTLSPPEPKRRIARRMSSSQMAEAREMAYQGKEPSQILEALGLQHDPKSLERFLSSQGLGKRARERRRLDILRNLEAVAEEEAKDHAPSEATEEEKAVTPDEAIYLAQRDIRTAIMWLAVHVGDEACDNNQSRMDVVDAMRHLQSAGALLWNAAAMNTSQTIERLVRFPLGFTQPEEKIGC